MKGKDLKFDPEKQVTVKIEFKDVYIPDIPIFCVNNNQITILLSKINLLKEKK